ncbi:MAG: YceI family protein [Bacteroidota bacterium]|nr:YceI family protein [Bacteroidota bacterium]
MKKIVLLISGFIFCFCSNSSDKGSLKLNDNQKNTDTLVNEPGRLLPRKLRNIPFGIVAGHFPNPCYAELENSKYVWKHNTTIVANKDLQIIEYGSFLYTVNGWYLRVTYSTKDFDEHYGTVNGQLKSGVTYCDPESWRMSDSLFAGDAMWYYIAKDLNGNLFKGIAPIETEGLMLKDVKIKEGYLKFSIANSTVKWTGYGEIGDYSLSGDLKLKTAIYNIISDTLKNAELVFDMNSITSDKKNLVDHLKGEDFFDCNKYPIAEFVLRDPIHLKKKSLEAKGILTIKGISQEISVPMNYSYENNQSVFSGKISFDRTKFNVKYNSKSFFSNLGDQAIKNTIDVEFKIKS